MLSEWRDFKDMSRLKAGIIVLFVEKYDDGWHVEVAGTRSYKGRALYKTRDEAKRAAATLALMQLGASETMVATADLRQARAGQGARRER